MAEEIIPPPPRAQALPGPWLDHAYGDRVRILDCPYANAALATMSRPGASYTELVAAVRTVTARLAAEAFAAELPRSNVAVETRMAAKHGAAGIWRGTGFDPAMEVVVLDVIRGGMIPAQTVFEMLTLVHPVKRLRLDHLSMERQAGADGHVESVSISGAKVGGSLEGRILIVPDPMGATGATVARAWEYLCREHGRPAKLVALPLICTPEFLRTVLALDPAARVWAGRIDRGMSPPDVLRERPGVRFDEESGLDESDYIVPGAGGLGELLNNTD